MARIKIEDLPVAEDLTPEQEELILGAGLRSFRPTLEALEGREMMDAGLGRSLLPPVVPPDRAPAQTRHPQVAPQGQQQSNFAQADAREITRVADNFLLHKIIT